MAARTDIKWLNRLLTVGRWPLWGKLAAVNVAVFVVLRVIAVAYNLSGEAAALGKVLGMLFLPSDVEQWIVKPWTILTYMFVQYDPMHLLINMLWLVVVGRLCAEIFAARRTVALYLCGGVAGGVAFIACCSMPDLSSGMALTGASASVMAMMGAVAVTMPNRRVMIPMFGDIRIKWVILTAVLLFVVAQLPVNPLSLSAHAGGFVAGMAMAALWRVRRGAVRPILKSQTGNTNATLDDLLDKIRRSGYGSLTEEERRRLFNISKDINQ